MAQRKEDQGSRDPAIWNSESGESVADTAAKFQIFFEKGDNERINGWMQMHYRFQFDDNGIPMMYIFNTCKAFIRTIPLMIYDEHAVEDLNTSLEDHCLTGDTQILTSEGYRCIESLIGTEGKVISHDGKEYAFSDVRCTRRNAEIYEAVLEDGTIIKGTKDHRIMLADGSWCGLGNLEGKELFQWKS